MGSCGGKAAEPPMKLPIALFGLVLLTFGCVQADLSAASRSGAAPTTQSLVPEEITAQPIAPAPAEEAAAEQPIPAPDPLPEAGTDEAAAPAGPLPSETPTVPVPAPEPAPAPAQSLSPEAVACLEAGNLWVRSGDTIVFACVRKTRDSGQQCTKGSDCEGECLARSMTCAPFDPLLGCNEILQDDGLRVTLCLN